MRTEWRMCFVLKRGSRREKKYINYAVDNATNHIVMYFFYINNHEEERREGKSVKMSRILKILRQVLNIIVRSPGYRLCLSPYISEWVSLFLRHPCLSDTNLSILLIAFVLLIFLVFAFSFKVRQLSGFL